MTSGASESEEIAAAAAATSGVDFVGTGGGEAERWFRERLRAHRVEPHPASRFNEALNAIARFADLRSGREAAGEDLDAVLRDALDTQYLIKAIHRCSSTILPQLEGRWDTFAGTDVCFARDVPSSGSRNRVWEILVAALMAHFAQDVRLWDEPDVRCSWKGTSYGVACKVLYSRRPDQAEKVVRIGAKNILQYADRGIVIVNAGNQISHERLLAPVPGQPGQFSHPRSGEDAKRWLLEALCEVGDRFRFKLNSILKSRRNVGGVVLFAHVAGGVGGTVPRTALVGATLFIKSLWCTSSDEEFVDQFGASIVHVPGYDLTQK